MKKFIALITVVMLITSLVGCGKSTRSATPVAPTNTNSASTVAPTTAVTEKPTESPTEKPSEVPTQAPTEPATEPPAEKTKKDKPSYRDKLIESKYVLDHVEDSQGNILDNYYGSIVAQTGAHMNFYEDDTFECVLGMYSWKGTFRIENGVVILSVEEAYEPSGKGETDYVVGLIWNPEENKSLIFKANGVKNYFVNRK